MSSIAGGGQVGRSRSSPACAQASLASFVPSMMTILSQILALAVLVHCANSRVFHHGASPYGGRCRQRLHVIKTHPARFTGGLIVLRAKPFLVTGLPSLLIVHVLQRHPSQESTYTPIVCANMSCHAFHACMHVRTRRVFTMTCSNMP